MQLLSYYSARTSFAGKGKGYDSMADKRAAEEAERNRRLLEEQKVTQKA